MAPVVLDIYNYLTTVQSYMGKDLGVHQPPPCPSPAQEAGGVVLAGPQYGKVGDQYATVHLLFSISILEKKRKKKNPSPKLLTTSEAEAHNVDVSYKT